MTHTAIGRWAVLCLATTSALAADAPELTFEKQVRPILKAHCFQCHGEAGKTEAKLDVRLKRLLEKGGEAGPDDVLQAQGYIFVTPENLAVLDHFERARNVGLSERIKGVLRSGVYCHTRLGNLGLAAAAVLKKF